MNGIYRVFMYFAFVMVPIAAPGQKANETYLIHKKKIKRQHSAAIKKANDSLAKKEQMRRMLEEKTQNKPWNSKLPIKESK